MTRKYLITFCLGNFFQIVPLRYLLSLTKQKLIFPFSHAISDERLPHIENLYPVRTIDLFVSGLEFLCKHYKPVTINEVHDIINNKTPINKPLFHLTFDDGLSQTHSVIAPILKRMGIPATFFINTKFVDNKDLFYRYKASLIIEDIKNNRVPENALTAINQVLPYDDLRPENLVAEILKIKYPDQIKLDSIAQIIGLDFDDFLKNQKPYLTSENIHELLQMGFAIGSHGLDHPHFKDVCLEVQKKQIKESFDFIEQNFSVKEKYFSFPFTDDEISKNLFDWLYETEKCDLSFGTASLKEDINCHHIHRIPIDGTLFPIRKIIYKEYIYYLLKEPFNKNKIYRAED